MIRPAKTLDESYGAMVVVTADRAAEILTAEGRRAHLIGVAGAGMKALAAVLRETGWRVTGSDAAADGATRGVFAGHRPEHVPADADLVVHSEAVGPENCERRQAARLGVPVLGYPQMLGRLAREKICLAVAGTHGKSTVAAMAATILIHAGLDPTVLCGAAPLESESGGRAGGGSHIVVEACEYRAHFLHLRPQVAVLLGIEPDHFDCFATDEKLYAAFAQFARQTDGPLIANAACPKTMKIVRRLAAPRETFAVEADADWRAVELSPTAADYEFSLYCHRQELGRVRLRVPGRHNVANALAAAALAHAAGASPEAILSGLREFRGLRRRLERKMGPAGATWLDDYAHHPTEVRAALAAARELCPRGKIWCVFQPHQASRLTRLLREFAASLRNADKTAIAEVFRAREGPPRPGEARAEDLAAEVRRRGSAVPAGHNEEDIRAWLADAVARGELTPDDLIITMSAGNLGSIGHAFSDWTGKIRQAG